MTGALITTACCIITGLIIEFVGKSVFKYVLIFGIGSYIVLIIYMICAIYRWEMIIVWISGGVIFGLCTFVDLVIGSLEVSFLKYVVVGVIGIGLMILCYVLYWDKDEEIVYAGIVSILISCIMTGLIFGFVGKSVFKYVLIFGIGSYIVLIIYVICVIGQGDMDNVLLSGFCIYLLCTGVGLIIGSLENVIVRIISIILAILIVGWIVGFCIIDNPCKSS